VNPRPVPQKNRQFLRFLCVGGFAAFINVLVRYFLSYALSYSVAIVLAYLVGMATAYILSKLLVFEETGRPAAHEMAWFTVVNLLAIAQVWAVSVGLARYGFPALNMTWHAETVAHAIGVSIPAITSYFGHKYFSFRPARKET
jgi:putative flippase GtrA